MKVRAARHEQVAALRHVDVALRIDRVVLRIKRLDALHAEVEHMLHERIVADELRVGKHRRAARSLDERDDLLRFQTVVRNIGGAAFGEHRIERLAHAGEEALEHERAPDVRTADGLARARDLQHIHFRNAIAELLQLPHHLREATPTRLPDIVQAFEKVVPVDVDIVSQDMDLTLLMMRAELDAGYDADALRGQKPLLIQMCDTVHGVVIRDRDVAKPRLLRCRHKFLGRHLSVGI